MKYATMSGDVVGTVHLYDPRPEVDAVEIPDDVYAGYVASGDGWLPPPDTRSLDETKTGKVGELRAACASAITGGYVSSALGSPHHYPSGDVDQRNMLGSVAASLLPDVGPGWTTPFWCRDEAGEWSFTAHSAAEIQRAGGDGRLHVIDCQTRLAEILERLYAAVDATEVASITWGE